MIVAVGIDLVDLDRIALAWSRHGERFLRRCFTAEEQGLLIGRVDPVPGMAARFAAKEAFQKVYPRTLEWRDVGVAHDARGAPELHYSPTLAAELAARGWRAHLSLTHAREQAAAVVVLEAPPTAAGA